MIVFGLDNTLRDFRCGGEFVPTDTTKTENWNDWQIWANNNGTSIKQTVEFYEKCIDSSKAEESERRALPLVQRLH